MCSIDGDSPDVYRSVTRRARKAHKCSECSRRIEVGETYARAAMMYDRHWSEFVTCSHCLVGQRWLLYNCNGFMHASLIEEMQEHADEYPDIRFGFLRVKAGILRRWQRFDGAGLMPLPPMPRAIEVLR